MKLQDIIEHDIVPKSRQKSRVLKRDLKMSKKYLPFTKAFSKLIDVTGGELIKDPAGGKVVSKH